MALKATGAVWQALALETNDHCLLVYDPGKTLKNSDSAAITAKQVAREEKFEREYCRCRAQKDDFTAIQAEGE